MFHVIGVATVPIPWKGNHHPPVFTATAAIFGINTLGNVFIVGLVDVWDIFCAVIVAWLNASQKNCVNRCTEGKE